MFHRGSSDAFLSLQINPPLPFLTLSSQRISVSGNHPLPSALHAYFSLSLTPSCPSLACILLFGPSKVFVPFLFLTVDLPETDEDEPI